MVTFFIRQIRQLRSGGFTSLNRKLRKIVLLPFRLLPLGLATIVVVLVRVLRPVCWIRFGPVRSDAMGHFVFDPAYYLCRGGANQRNRKDLFFLQHCPPANEQWAIMLRRALNMHPAIFYLDRANRMLPGGTGHIVRLLPEGQGSIDPLGFLLKAPSPLRFTEEEEARGRRFLDRIGLNQAESFVCLIVRDSAYKSSISPSTDWSYHDYRDSCIEAYELAACALADQGYWVFRMGKAVRKPFQVRNPRIVDYATSSHRSDFLDVWLPSHCEFAVTTGTGLDEVCTVFGRQYVHVNQVPVGGIRSFTPSIVTFKHLRWKSTGTPLSLKEQITSGSIYALHKSTYDHLGIEVIDNTPQEILEATLEFEAIRLGLYKETQMDIDLQDKFWSTLRGWSDFGKYHDKIHATVSPSFLRKNHSWFLP